MSDDQVVEQPTNAMPPDTGEQSQGGEPEAPETPEAPDLATQLSQAQAQAAEYLDGWQRAVAELSNVKKRLERERAQLQLALRGEVIAALLPALDDFDLALENLPQDIAQHEWVNGMMLIRRKFWTQLADLGLTEIEADGQEFDPELHEAVLSEPSDDHQPGHVISVVRKGYRLGDRVIRPARVKVAS